MLNTDELLYAAMIPLGVSQTVGRLGPIKVPRAPSCSGLDVGAIMGFVLSAGSVCFFAVAVLNPQTGRLADAHDVLCGGNQHFVFTMNG